MPWYGSMSRSLINARSSRSPSPDSPPGLAARPVRALFRRPRKDPANLPDASAASVAGLKTFAVRIRHLPPKLGSKRVNNCQLGARCHLRLGVVVWIQPLRRTAPTLSPVLIGVPVRSPNGAHDNGIETMKKFLLGTVGVGCFWDGRSCHGC